MYLVLVLFVLGTCMVFIDISIEIPTWDAATEDGKSGDRGGTIILLKPTFRCIVFENSNKLYSIKILNVNLKINCTMLTFDNTL